MVDEPDSAERVRVELSADAVGQRLDRALVTALAARGLEVSRSRLAKAFERGEVWLDGVVAKPSRTIEAPTSVEVEIPRPEPLKAVAEALPLDVVYEDAELLVVNKPAPMVVHPSAGHARGTLVGAILHHLGVEPESMPVLPGNDDTRPGIVHRIDKDTSGLLVVAKTPAAQTALARAFAAHAIERRYIALIAGVPTWETRRIETGHGRDPVDRRRFSPTGTKRRAVTTATCEERLYKSAKVSFTLETGRTHQIRMHARHLGHPLLGDAIYGHRPQDRWLAARVEEAGRHALHAAVLGFAHPKTGRALHFETRWPPELERLYQALRRGP